MSVTDGIPPAPMRHAGAPPAARILRALMVILAVLLEGLAVKTYHNVRVMHADRDALAVWNVAQLEADYRDLVLASHTARSLARIWPDREVEDALGQLRSDLTDFDNAATVFLATLHKNDLSQDFGAGLAQLGAARQDLAARVTALSLCPDIAQEMAILHRRIVSLAPLVEDLAKGASQRLMARAASLDRQESATRATMTGLSIAMLVLTLLAVFLAGHIAHSKDMPVPDTPQGDLRRSVREAQGDDVPAAQDYRAAQDRFLATMSHELRTPLHGVRAALDLLARQPLPGAAERLVAVAQQSCGHALAQSDRALNAIRGLDAPECPEAFDPVTLTADLIAEMGLIAQDTGSVITLQCRGARLGDRFLGQPLAFGRAMGNLIANAATHAPGGTILVALDFADPDAMGQVTLRAAVSDDGPGIAADDLGNIFAPFNHALLSGQRPDMGGLGMGFSIVRQAVAEMGGEITVQSEIGQGCHAQITVPLHRAEAAGDAPLMALAQGGIGAGKAALVVDDARVNCDLVAQMLGQLGYRADIAFCGAEAVRMAKATAYDLILLDFEMPGMTGPEAALQITQAGPSAGARIIGMTARVDLDTAHRGLPPGMSHVFIKPFGIAELEACLSGSPSPHAPESFAPCEDEMALLRATLEMCGEVLGMALLQDTLGLAQHALAELDQDPASCAETAHRAAGAAMMAGFHELGGALRDLEQAARAQADQHALAPLAERLAMATRKAQATLAAIEALAV